MSVPLFPFEESRSIDPPPQAVEMQAINPVPRVRLRGGDEVRLATRYDDVRRVLTDPVLHATGSLDARLRLLASTAFTAETIERLRPRVEQLVAELLDDMAIKGAPVDLVACLADPMPTIVLGELLAISSYDIEPGLLPLFEAGRETTTSQLTASVFVLGRHPDEWDRLVADPSLVPAAVEELLRYVSSGAVFPRQAAVGLVLSGVPVAAGETILPLVGVANRDPVVFPHPDRFEVTRMDAGLHLAFGRGCLGASLARMQLRIALTALVTLFPTLRLADPECDAAAGGLKTLLVAW